jgi:hypothetical protein
MQELAVSQRSCCGEMVRAGENRHFFPLTSLQIGYVFRGIFSLVLGFCHAIVGSLPTIRLPASGCQLAGEVLVLTGVMEQNAFGALFFPVANYVVLLFVNCEVVKIAMGCVFYADLLFMRMKDVRRVT